MYRSISSCPFPLSRYRSGEGTGAARRCFTHGNDPPNNWSSMVRQEENAKQNQRMQRKWQLILVILLGSFLINYVMYILSNLLSNKNAMVKPAPAWVSGVHPEAGCESRVNPKGLGEKAWKSDEQMACNL